jgi:DNA-binding NarL/FixJ family response regulator
MAELLRGHGFMVAECAVTGHLSALARSLDVVLVDLDHYRRDVRTMLRAVHAALDGVTVVPMGSALRQGASLDDPRHAGVETPGADADSLVAAARLVKARPSSELLRHFRAWSKLTPRQRDVLRWVATGLDNRGIALRLRIGERAVKAHVSSLLVRFDIDNRAELALCATSAGVRPIAA